MKAQDQLQSAQSPQAAEGPELTLILHIRNYGFGGNVPAFACTSGLSKDAGADVIRPRKHGVCVSHVVNWRLGDPPQKLVPQEIVCNGIKAGLVYLEAIKGSFRGAASSEPDLAYTESLCLALAARRYYGSCSAVPSLL